MNKSIGIFMLIVFNFISSVAFSQKEEEVEALGLPGDNLNLYAVLDVFQKSKTLEDFEKAINDKVENINNLDLNDDKNIDYIKVVSEKEGDANTIILQVAISASENQDIAVIEVSKDKSGNITVQIIGDEELYGKDYIVEPSNEMVAGTPNPGYNDGGTTIINNNTTNNYNTTNDNGNNYESAGAWPVVLYLFSPVYVVYRSPFYWGFYPSYWSPWAPVYYQNYWGYHNHYHRNRHYRRTTIIINNGHYRNYYGRRNTSVIVVNNRRNGNYNRTYNGKVYRRPAAITRPSTRPSTTRPTSRPSTTRPSSTRPATRPSTARPSTRPNTTRPTSRPSTTRPSTTRPSNSKQVNRTPAKVSRKATPVKRN